MASPKQAARQQGERKRVSALDWGDDRGYKSHHLKLPSGVEEWRPQIGTHEIDIMPYRAGEGHPNADAGYEVFNRPYAAHRLEAGGRKSLFCCRWACWKLPCPVCTFRNSRDCAPELAKELYAASRDLFLINDNPGKKVRWKVLDQTFKNRGQGFGEMLKDELDKLRKEFPFDLESGYSLVLTVKEQVTPTFKYNAVTRIDVRARDYSYPPELLDKAPCLDEMLIDPGEQELLDILGSGGGRTGRPSSVVGNGKPRDDEDEDDDDTTPKARRRIEPEEEDEDEPRPQARRRAADPDPAEDDDDTDDDEQEDLVPARAKKKADPTAKDLGLEEGMQVEYEGDVYTIKKVSGDGTSLTLVDGDGERVNGVAPDEVKVRKAAKPAKRAEPEEEDEDDEPAPKAKGRKATEPDDEDETEEDEPAPPKKGGKAKAAAAEDEDDFGDGWDDDEENDESKPAPKAKGKKR